MGSEPLFGLEALLQQPSSIQEIVVHHLVGDAPLGVGDLHRNAQDRARPTLADNLNVSTSKD